VGMVGSNRIAVSLLTGGSDRPYVFGLATSLQSAGTELDLIGSDELDNPAFHGQPGVRFLSLRGSQRPDVGTIQKIARISLYYIRLIRYVAVAEPKVFHILWNNRFETFDRTLLMLYYKLLGKKIVLTAHNVNTRKRDSKDSRLNRLTLATQYRLADHIFVHTPKMKEELVADFRIRAQRVDVIPFGINNSVPNTALTPEEAKRRLGVEGSKSILFFGRITPYKGLDCLAQAFRLLLKQRPDYRLIIAGRPDRADEYWRSVRQSMLDEVANGRVLIRDEFIPDDETEVYFKAADVFALPYRDIYQSGVLFLGQSFGLPVVASDVGSFKEDIVEGWNGFVFQPGNPDSLATAIGRYFESQLYAELDTRRSQIRDRAEERHSWTVVARSTTDVYATLLRIPRSERFADQNPSEASADAQAHS
jgi:glycosyltransferase involved in cell wall biosynthesis